MGDRIAILREGGVLAQYDTPDAILEHPADDFVAQFIGEDRALRRLALQTLRDVQPDRARLERPGSRVLARHDHPQRGLASCSRPAPRRSSSSTAARSSACSGSRTRERCCEARRRAPVIPNFGHGSSCVTGDHVFCWGWVRGHWGDTLGPALVAARRADRDRRRHRLRARVPARRSRHTASAASSSRSASSRRCSTRSRASRCSSSSSRSPGSRGRRSRSRSSATRSSSSTRTSSPACAARPTTCSRRRAAWGSRRCRCLTRVELPLAVPAIIGGLRVAVVSTISIATIAAFVGPYGPRQPDLPRAEGADAVQDGDLLRRLPRCRRSRSRATPRC